MRASEYDQKLRLSCYWACTNVTWQTVHWLSGTNHWTWQATVSEQNHLIGITVEEHGAYLQKCFSQLLRANIA